MDEISNFLLSSVGLDFAIETVGNIARRCKKLETFPDQGGVNPELERLGIFDYREIHEDPYRIIYQIMDKSIIIHAIFDARRDIQSLLQERLIR